VFTGGVHANELAPPRASEPRHEIARCYAPPRKTITYGAFSLTANDVKDVIERIDIYFAPMINPDGYALALGMMARAISNLWGGKMPGQAGRAHRRVWRRQYQPQLRYRVGLSEILRAPPASDVGTSSDPCDANYSGISPGPVTGTAFSEPESQNIKTLLDEGIEFYVDCHMYGPTILHSWGIGRNQTTDSTMWFGNPP